MDFNKFLPQFQQGLTSGGLTIPGAIPMSSSVNPNAMNFRIPGSSSSTQTNLLGNPIYSNTPSSPSGQVQGASTGPSNGGGGDSAFDILAKTDRNPEQERQYQEMLWQQRAEQDRRQQEEYARQVNESYGPHMNFLNEWLQGVQGAQATKSANLKKDYDIYSGRIPGEEKQLLGQLDASERTLANTNQSAFDQAVRAYNSLKQQGQVRAGAGSSLGGALGELAAKEFARAQGVIGQQATAGQQQIEQARQQISTFISQKKQDLDIQLRAAQQALDENFRTEIAQINANRAATEGQKTRDKMAALQNTIAQAQQLKTTAQQFQQELALSAVEQFANTAGRALQPAEIQAIVAPFVSQISSAAQPSYNLLSSGIGGVRSREDELSGIVA